LLQPYETHAWHSDSGLEQDLSRSARRLTGRSVGIVLGGGGARAFAHLGVLEELTAAGITIDRVGGVSMGSYIGALFASGLTIDEIDAHCYENWVRRNPLGDYTIPRHSLIRGRRAEAMGRRTFGSTRIEELQLSFFALAADLRAGEPFVYRHGSLVEAIGASMSLPGLAPPRIQGQRMMVDGALVDNLPVSVMAESGSGPIIASDIRMGSARPAGAAPPQRGHQPARVSPDRPRARGRPRGRPRVTAAAAARTALAAPTRQAFRRVGRRNPSRIQSGMERTREAFCRVGKQNASPVRVKGQALDQGKPGAGASRL
jgi:NTE family protein